MADTQSETLPAADGADDVLPRCGALVLAALIANNGITGIELEPQSETLFLRYDPRRTTADRVEAIADTLRPALRRHAVPAEGPGRSAGGRLERRPVLVPATTVQRI